MKKGNVYFVGVMAAFFFGMTFLVWTKTPDDYSDSERRALAAFPVFGTETLKDGTFMTAFETYTLDQFPMRDQLRTIKALARTKVFRQKDNNDIYTVNGYTSKLEYPIYPDMLEYAGKKFKNIYDLYLADTGCKLYFAVVPDKNYYLAKENGYLSMDYDAFYRDMQEKTSYMEFLDLRPWLSLEDYYYTDTHWKQPSLQAVAQNISERMGNTLRWTYEEVTATQEFYGVYAGQSALPLKPDTLSYLTNDQLEACQVVSYATGKPADIKMYQLEEVNGKDPYELFLDGAEPLLEIYNPHAATDKELILFRDSFGSSLAPLLAESYRKVTLVDIRYMNSAALGSFISFEDQDVLFLYSTLVLNSSTSLR